jgi:hypothetical protein
MNRGRIPKPPPAWRGAVLATGAFLTIGVLIFPSAGWDDAYITYWAAHAVSDLGRIVNVNGDAVEQSSSLGFVLVIALLRRLTGVDASIAGRLASIAFGAAAVWATASLGYRVSSTVGRFSPAVVATCTYFVYWSFGGMETSLAAMSGVLLLIALSQVLDERGGPVSPVKLTLAAAASLVFVSSRPEGGLVLAATLAGLAGVLVLRRRQREIPEAWEARARRALPAFALASVASIGAVLAFRFWYFGHAFPQPVYVKAHALSRQKIFDGLRYTFESVQSDFLIVAVLGGVGAGLLVLSGAVSRKRPSAEIVSAVFLLANVLFIVMSGGDGMHGGRFFLPAIPAAAVLGVSLLSRILSAQQFRWVAAVWVAVQIGGVFVFARTQSHSDPAWAVASADEAGFGGRFHWFERANHDHRRYFPVVIELEREIDRLRAQGRPVSILSGQSGFVMFHLARTHRSAFRYFDRFALATTDFSECSISAGLPHTEWGLLLTVEHYLSRLGDFQQQCGIEPPDIIFELYSGAIAPEFDRIVKTAGYALTYVVPDDRVARSRAFPGQPAEGVYIAVRRDRLR